MYYRSNNIMAYFSPGEDGKFLLQHALYFQKTLGMRIFICHINENPAILKRLFKPKNEYNTNNITLQKLREFSESALPADAKTHFSYRVRVGKPVHVLLRQSNKGGYEFMIV
ncbi:MAG: hypothetical protein JW833_12990, partial [Prolixibacteraceae bacterium]|nr:hypothetical protein [Prolixibacteraceae bacterium]